MRETDDVRSVSIETRQVEIRENCLSFSTGASLSWNRIPICLTQIIGWLLEYFQAINKLRAIKIILKLRVTNFTFLWHLSVDGLYRSEQNKTATNTEGRRQ